MVVEAVECEGHGSETVQEWIILGVVLRWREGGAVVVVTVVVMSGRRPLVFPMNEL